MIFSLVTAQYAAPVHPLVGWAFAFFRPTAFDS